MNKTVLVILGLCFLYSPGSLANAGEIAIVVNRANPIDGLALRELVKIFKQERQHWEDKSKIYLIVREAGGVERELILKKIYEMDDMELKKFWLGKLFREEIASFPKTLGSNEAVKRFVSQVPNAIGFTDASVVDSTVKVLRIDGRAPGERGYVLGDNAR